MAISDHNQDIETSLLKEENKFVDYKNRPVNKSRAGGWRSAYFLIGVQLAESFVYFGICSNLISYLTGPLGQSTATAAANVNAWSGATELMPILGALVADSFVGRYCSILVGSAIYILGLCLLTLSAATLSSVNNNESSSSTIELVLFFFSLYLIAIGVGAQRPCAQAFGADQFDGEDPVESKSRSSFFNWSFFASCLAIILSVATIVYIQDNFSWVLGFGIPCVVMIVALVIFLLGTTTYRHTPKEHKSNPLNRIGQVFFLAIRNRNATLSDVDERDFRPTFQFRFLNKALLVPQGSIVREEVCTHNDVNDAKALLSLVPIWITGLAYAIVSSQSSTFFTKQGATMDRTIAPGFKIPAASLQCFVGLGMLIFLPIYDRVLVPAARLITQKPSGITLLQRIGTGMILSAISMVVAALVEKRRLKIAQEYKLINIASATVPMSVWWLAPQYMLLGIGGALCYVGFLELFYNQVPNDLKSVGASLNLSMVGVGSFLSSFLISAIDKATSRSDDQYSWLDSNINRARLDLFYWVLLGLDAFGIGTYIYYAKSYVYYKGSSS